MAEEPCFQAFLKAESVRVNLRFGGGSDVPQDMSHGRKDLTAYQMIILS